jgi:hypothetical protein
MPGTYMSMHCQTHADFSEHMTGQLNPSIHVSMHLEYSPQTHIYLQYLFFMTQSVVSTHI